MKLSPARDLKSARRLCPPIACSVLPLLLIPALAAAQDEIFVNGFDTGQMCSWSEH